MSVDSDDPRLRASIEAFNRGDLSGEASFLEPLLDEHPDDVRLLQRMGAVVAQLGDLKRAKDFLSRARDIDPDNIYVLQMLAWIARRLGDQDEANRLNERVMALDPDNAAPYVDLGRFNLAQGEIAAALECFEKALAIEPTSVDALVSLASLCERRHEFEEALRFAERAVALAPEHGQANITLARVELRSGQTQRAVERMQNLLATARISEADAASALYLIGQAVDKLGDFDHAFVAFQSANNMLHELYGPAVASMDSVLAPERLQKIHTHFETEDVAGWTTVPDGERPDPVFLVGFPRSGTTLLDQVLNAHSAIDTLEEKEHLIDVRNELVRPDGGLAGLAGMTKDDVDAYRQKYWSRVRENAGRDLAGGILIDKMPLNTILLGLIYRLFPKAKIIFAVRDPRDVVLSCFQQRFGVNVAMYQLLKLETAAAYYDQVMKIGAACRQRLPLDLHIVRYEDVVGDMESTVADLLAFLGLPWEAQMADYRDQARRRWITTPSAEQVIEPLYDTSIGKWRSYRRHMEPVLSVLEPWVDAFGYEAS